jgi:hypothetical protein
MRMAVRVEWVFTGVVLLAVLILWLLGSNDSEVNGLVMFVIWYGGIAVGIVWLLVLLFVGLRKALSRPTPLG